MADDHSMHARLPHRHGPGCGHPVVFHAGHSDYLQDGKLLHPVRGGVEEHVLPIGPSNPDACTRHHACGAHAPDHVHGPGCGHLAVPHGGHIDYWIDGHLHHPHGSHCDDHGPVTKGAW
jgi:hypothetical protein